MNDMTFTQAAQVLNGVVQQMTGQTALATIATPEDFVTVAQTALKGGMDPVVISTSSIPTPTGTATTWATAEDGTVDGMEVTYVGKAT